MANKRPPRPPAAEQLYRARKAFAKEFDLPITDWPVKRLALLSCARDTIEAKLAAGQSFDLGELLRLDQAIAEIRNALKAAAAMTVTIEIVGEECQYCGKRSRVRNYTPPPPAVTRDTPAPAASASRTDNVVVPIKPKPKPDFHPATDFHAGAPVKRDVARNEYLGCFISPARPFEPTPDHSYKPRTPGT